MTVTIPSEPGEQLLRARPRLRSDVVLGAAQYRGPVRVHQVRVVGTGRSLEVGTKEHFLMSRLDGTWTLGEIGGAYEREFDKALSPASWGQILATLGRSGLLAVDDTPPEPPRPRTKGGRHARRLPPPTGRIRTYRLVHEPSGFLDRVLRGTRFAFSAWIVLPVLVAVVAMEVLLAGRIAELAEQTLRLVRQPGPLLLAGVTSWLLAAVHELAHGVAARRYGVPVQEIGVKWLPPFAMPYCRTDSYLYLPRRRAHVVIAGAGVLVELALLLPAFAAWWWLAPTGTTGAALGALLLGVSFHALVNLLPVPPLDGYKLLSHSLGVSGLAPHTGLYLGLRARRDPRAAAYPRSVRVVFGAYAALNLAAISVLAAGLVLASYTWLGGGIAAVITAGLLVAAAVAGVRIGTRFARRRPPGGRAEEVPAQAGVTRTPAMPAMPPAQSPAALVSTRTPSPPATTRVPALLLEGVVKEYAGVRAVDGVRLEVAAGEFLGLLGPNGAGKTTLIEMAVGLRQADAGTVSVLGASPWPRRRAMLRRIGVQTQSAAYFVRLTAREHLRTVAALYGLGHEAAEDALHLVGLGRQGNTRADRLSGGQQQRLAIASALVHDPELIFLDEPTASLDPEARRQLWTVLRDLHEGGRTVVYTTHHIDEAEALCTQVAIMARGSIVAAGTPHSLIESAALPTRVVAPREALSVEAATALAQVTTAALEGPSVVMETHDSAAVLAALHASGAGRGVLTRSPTLEDVYLDCLRREKTS